MKIAYIYFSSQYVGVRHACVICVSWPKKRREEKGPLGTQLYCLYMVRTFAVHAYVKSPTKQVIPLCTGSLSLSLPLCVFLFWQCLNLTFPHQICQYQRLLKTLQWLKVRIFWAESSQIINKGMSRYLITFLHKFILAFLKESGTRNKIKLV